MPDENPWVRVTDKDTKMHVSVRESALPHGNYSEPLKQDATDAAGDPLPPEPLSSTTTSGQSADPKKETPNG